ncbi:hypothetical protein [Pseudogemmobacter bohemicus]|uniref:hypothetical protein n=1 Tax=Pseudogemmobacter bohemicus TaxID=2250708 RepID=UPI000DD4C27D|nr:hypothetical protein [Pseudogemmobacter bohemicus]
MTLLALASFSTFLRAGWQVLQNPLAKPVLGAAAGHYAARRELATERAATPESIAARIAALLDEEDHNRIAIEALEDLAESRGIALPDDLNPRINTLREEDNGWLVWGEGCAKCTFGSDACSLNHALICSAPVSSAM